MEQNAIQAFEDLIRRRLSVESFDPDRDVGEALIRRLVEDAAETPSSFNIQHWRFVAVRGAEDRERLCRAAYGQRQVADAPVTFIILGDLQGADHLPELLDRAVEQGVMARPKADAWVRQARQIYADAGQARDEALRSCSLAAMTMMLAAEAQGLATCPLSGFDAEQVRREFGVADRFVPVMLLSVGYPAEIDTARKPRLGVDEILAFDRSSF